MMTARVLRPALTITTVVAVLVAALAVYAFTTMGGAHADSVYNPTTEVWMCNRLPAAFGSTDPSLVGDPTCGVGGPPEVLTASSATDYTVILNMASGDLNFSNVVTMSPNAPTSVGVGDKVGGLRSLTNLGLINNQCNTALSVDFVFYNVALPNAATRAGMTNIAWPQAFGVTDRFERWQSDDGQHTSSPPLVTDPEWADVTDDDDALVTSANGTNADGTTLSIANYPSYLLDIFDPDFVPGVSDGAMEPLIPTATYGGLTLVSGDWIPLYFVIFPAGGLTTLPTPLGAITTAMGVPSVSILTDPSAVQPSPSSISDFCTSLNVTTMLRSTVHTNPAGAGTGLYVQYNASLRDTDQDGYENAIDTCPVSTPAAVGGENPRATPGAGDGDADDDGIKDSCDTNLPDAADADVDNDGYQNRQDNCPQDSNDNVESELGTLQPDYGPRADTMGNDCDSGSVTITQNGVSLTITLGTTTGNGRYLVATNVVAKCFGGTDADADGYCTAGGSATDNADSGACAVTVPNSCKVRHASFIVGACATSPGCQMDSDGDTVPVPPLVPSNWSDAVEAYLGTDATKPCSFSTTADNEGPTNLITGKDAWPLDVNDNRGVSGADWLRVAGVINNAGAGGPGRAVNMGGNGDGTTTISATVSPPVDPFMGTQKQSRFDLNWDGQLVAGSDLGKFNSYMGKSCGGAGAPPLNSNGSASFQQ